MIDRRTFLKLSAGALVLTAAGALTGCGDTVIEKTSGVAKIGDVTFICATPFTHGGAPRQLTYWTKFTIQNNSTEKVVIKPEDITCIFREADAEETLYFKRKELVAEPGRTADYNGSQEFFLETGVPGGFLFCAALPVLYIGAGIVHKVLRTFCTSMVAAGAAKR